MDSSSSIPKLWPNKFYSNEYFAFYNHTKSLQYMTIYMVRAFLARDRLLCQYSEHAI